ncbi:flavin reductase [Geoalkalibacter halelectricus]|uniref:Flavin reductase n=1 Tax=Geoalkalibacter halelectricus TaxID=2847045 RepID=A0ABY5ZMC5_9BACT|nr:flavin reductase [Geoalkalibacter halelectricus]MDO3378922.1 flavin reductase [Geoalkalibacter halelectricus]UWZ79055.1 flavin reductase [Geoalkalibacter halelectricus]
MPIRSLFALYPQLMACPLALVSWRGEDGGVCWEIVDWVGVVCEKPARLSFNLVRSGFARTVLARTGQFAVSLPDDHRLARLREHLRAPHAEREGGVREEFLFEGFTPEEPPFLAGCPVIFSCSLKEARTHHGRLHVCGLVREVRIQGQSYGIDAEVNVCNLQPFHRRWFQGALPAEPQVS